MKQKETTLSSEVLTNTAHLVCSEIFEGTCKNLQLLESYITAYLFGAGKDKELKKIEELTNMKFSMALTGYKLIVENNNISSLRALDFYFYDNKKGLEERLFQALLHNSNHTVKEKETLRLIEE